MPMTTLLAPVQRQTLAHVVMERLVEYIRQAGLGAGDPLPSQHELARQLSVSRPILREAMQGLASVGLIEIRPGSGCYVRDPHVDEDPESLIAIQTHETALELLEARLLVEVELAGLAVSRATANDFERMETILNRLRRAVNRGQLSSPITGDFHQALARAGHNTVLYRMAQLLAKQRVEQGLRVELALPDVVAGEYESHRRLYDAVRSGDEEIARAAMRDHLRTAHGWENQISDLRAQMQAAGSR
jgi:GntR family transcriptional regulator, transcriptional repressor for pyruvate dehydrogenase complex